MTLAARATLTAAMLAALLAGALQAVVAARVGVAGAVALPVAAAAAAAVLWRPVLGAQLALLAIPLEIFSLRLGGSAGLSATELLLLLTAGAALLQWTAQRRRPHAHPAFLALAALSVVVLLSLLVAEERAPAIKVAVMWTAFGIVGLLVADSSPADLWRILRCLAIAGGLVGLVAIATRGNQTLDAGGAVATNRAQGAFAQPNVLGFFLVMAIPACLVLSSRGRPLARVAMLVLAGCAFWGLLLTLSRTSLIGAGLSLALLLVWPPFRRAAAVGLAVLIVFSLVNFKAIESSREVSVVSQRLATLGQSSAVGTDPRTRIWRTGAALFGAHPLLGVGEANFAVASQATNLRDEIGTPFDHAHDVPLTFAAELGVPGLLAFGWLAIAAGALVLGGLRRRGDPRLDLLALGPAAAIAGMLVPSLGDYPPRTNAIAGTFLVLVGVLAAVERLRREGYAAGDASVR
jgi:O-antigen ligase